MESYSSTGSTKSRIGATIRTIGLVMVFTAITVWFYTQQKNQGQFQRSTIETEKISSGRNLPQRNKPKVPQQPQAPAAAMEAVAPPTPTAQPQPEPVAEAVPEKAAPQPQSRVSITVVNMGKSPFERLAAATNRGFSETGDMSYSVISNFSDVSDSIKREPTYEVLGYKEEKNLTDFRQKILSVGPRTDKFGAPVGLSVVVTPMGSERQEQKIRFNVTMTTPTVENNELKLDKKNLAATVLLPKKSAIAVAPLLAGITPIEDEDLYRHKLFGVLTDDDFINGESAVVLLIEVAQ